MVVEIEIQAVFSMISLVWLHQTPVKHKQAIVYSKQQQRYYYKAFHLVSREIKIHFNKIKTK